MRVHAADERLATVEVTYDPTVLVFAPSSAQAAARAFEPSNSGVASVKLIERLRPGVFAHPNDPKRPGGSHSA